MGNLSFKLLEETIMLCVFIFMLYETLNITKLFTGSAGKCTNVALVLKVPVYEHQHFNS